MSLIRSYSQDGIRVEVFHHQLRTGHFEFWFIVDQATSNKKRWIQLAAIPDGQMQSIIDLLQKALDSLDRGWRQFRSISIRNKSYYVDDRLLQLRNVDDPSDFVDLAVLE